MNQKILPVISDWKILEKFLKRKETWCILMDFHINFMEDIVSQLHQHNKKVIVHMDLIKGIQNDQYGTQYMCQKLHVDGIISTKPKAIEAAKANHAIAILRVFMIDSRSVLRGAKLCENLQPDYIEVLPAIVPNAVRKIQEYCEIPVIGGGLIQTKEDINNCITNGMVAITTSNISLLEEE